MRHILDSFAVLKLLMIQKSFWYALFKEFSIKSGKPQKGFIKWFRHIPPRLAWMTTNFGFPTRVLLYIIPGQKTPCPTPSFYFCPSRDLCCFHDLVLPFQSNCCQNEFPLSKSIFSAHSWPAQSIYTYANAKMAVRLAGSKSQERVDNCFTVGKWTVTALILCAHMFS